MLRDAEVSAIALAKRRSEGEVALRSLAVMAAKKAVAAEIALQRRRFEGSVRKSGYVDRYLMRDPDMPEMYADAYIQAYWRGWMESYRENKRLGRRK